MPALVSPVRALRYSAASLFISTKNSGKFRHELTPIVTNRLSVLTANQIKLLQTASCKLVLIRGEISFT
jgi:hypothetical protein